MCAGNLVQAWYGIGDGEAYGPMDARIESVAADGRCVIVVLDAVHLEFVGFGQEDNPDGDDYRVTASPFPADGWVRNDDYVWAPVPAGDSDAPV